MFSSNDNFWLKNFPKLFSNFRLVPSDNLSLDEQMNALTRLVFLVFLILLLIDFRFSFIFLLLALLLIIIFYYIQRKKMKEGFECRPRQKVFQNDSGYVSGPPVPGLVVNYHDNRITKTSPIYSNEYVDKRAAQIVDNAKMLSINNMPVKSVPPEAAKYLPKGNKLKIQTPEQYRFCNTAVKLHYDERFKSSNQALVGGPNPKTLKPVVIVPPPAAFDYWMANHAVHSKINDVTSQELYQSGYVVSNCCGYADNKLKSGTDIVCKCSDGDINPPNNKCAGVEEFGEIIEPIRENFESVSENFEVGENETYNGYMRRPTQIVSSYQDYKYPYQSEGECVTCCDGPALCEGPDDKGKYFMTHGYPGDVNTMCGYSPEQIIENNLPSNVRVGECQRQPEFDCYNKLLFTQNIQPDMYARGEIIEPLNSNIGISFDQQFPPVTCEEDCHGTTYVSHDPRMIDLNSKAQPSMNTGAKVRPDNVYDPRFSGYGTSYRSYIDELTGRPRFYYGDVDAIRRPNFIIRSNIDDAPWADSYGPVRPLQERFKSDWFNRSMAQDKFLRDSLEQRNSLQERFTRKYNQQIGWQRRIAPLRRDNGGCMNKCKS